MAQWLKALAGLSENHWSWAIAISNHCRWLTAACNSRSRVNGHPFLAIAVTHRHTASVYINKNKAFKNLLKTWWYIWSVKLDPEFIILL